MQACDGFRAHVSHLDGSVVVALIGEIDMATAPHFRAVLESAMAASNHVILDCERLTFIDSCCLREVVLASNALAGQGSLRVHNLTGTPMRALLASGLAAFLDIDAVSPDAN